MSEDVVQGPIDDTVEVSTSGIRPPVLSARRVVIISATFPDPPDGGNKVVLAGLVRYLASRVGAANVHWVLVGGPMPRPREDMVVHPVPRAGGLRRLGALLRRSVLGGASLQEAVLWSAETRDATQEVLSEVAPDLVVVDTVRMAQYLRSLDVGGAETVCYLDDLYSERYRAMMALRRDEPDVDVRPLATFAATVPARLRWLTEWAPTQRMILSFEARRVRRSELRTTFEVDRALLVNANEVERLRGWMAREAPPGRRPARVSTIRPLARPTGAGPVRRAYAGAPHYLIVGIMSGPHNEIALRWLITEVLPLLRAGVPDLRLDVVGREPSRPVRELAESAPDVALHGFVPDLEPFLATTCAVLNPPRYASGIKLKVLDALAAGVPVVSTTPGADGVVTGPGQGVLHADGAETFAAAMLALRDPGHNAAVAADGRRHHAEWFAEEPVFRHYDAVLGDPVLGEGAVPVPRAR